MTYADNLLIAIYQGRISINYCVDYQLLIRICYLFRLCIVIQDGKCTMKEGTTAELLDAILNSPVLLPALVLRSRCSGDCREKGKVELPRTSDFPEGRGEDSCKCTCDETASDRAATASASTPTSPISSSSRRSSPGTRKATLPTSRTSSRAS